MSDSKPDIEADNILARNTDAAALGESAGTADLTAILEQILPPIDRNLAAEDVPIKDRPLQAAMIFASTFVEAVQDGGTAATDPGKPTEFVAAPWFAAIYGHVENWYRRHYPGALDQRHNAEILGLVLIAGTTFPLRVPTILMQPGSTERTRWMSIPDSLREGESALDWVDNPPNRQMLTEREAREAEEFAAEVAGNLRFIRTGLMGAKGDAAFAGFRSGIIPRLERAAELLLEPRTENVAQAYWELQLASEMALKALLQQRAGAFRQTHDLFLLYDECPANAAPAFNRDLLKRLPRWEEMADMRYGQGRPGSRRECIKAYRTTLKIVAGAVKAMEKMDLGQARFEIGRPPWFG